MGRIYGILDVNKKRKFSYKVKILDSINIKSNEVYTVHNESIINILFSLCTDIDESSCIYNITKENNIYIVTLEFEDFFGDNYTTEIEIKL